MRTIPSFLLWTVFAALAACDTTAPSGAGNTNAGASASASATAKDQVPAPPDVAAAPADAQKTDSGLAYKVLQPGAGTDKPKMEDSVRIHYTGWTTDGRMFGTSTRQGRPSLVSMKGIIPGLSEALSGMVPGEKRRVWIPPTLADKGWPDPPKVMTVFDLELLEVVPGPKTVPVPEDVAAPPKDAKKTKSGLYSKVIKQGTGKVHPKATDTVKVHYSGWTTDGKMFDSSETRGQPTSFPLDGVIKGWTEGVQLMVEGEKRRFWIPEDLAYKGVAGKPQGMLVFDVELIKIMVPPKAPSDVAKPPADAEKTASGLATKVLQPGTGKVHPTASSRVQVEYTGWTTDGKMFDSSITRGQPASFALNGVIPGWTEGLQLMVEGERRRLWIPENLAYKGRPGKPKGMLVFDVELIKIQDP